jgi:HEAT repeat protein
VKKPVRLVIWVLAILAAGFGVALAVPSCRSDLLGRLRGEPFAEGRPVSHWVDTLRTGNDAERAHAAHVLGESGTDAPGVVAGLAGALKDENPIVRRNAAAALARFGAHPDTVAALLGALKDSESTVRQEAARSLAQVRPLPGDAVGTLLETIRADRDPVIRVFAITAIGHAGDRATDAIPDLIDMLKERPGGSPADPSAAAMGVLAAIGPAARPTLIAALDSKEARTRAAAAGLLGGMGPVPPPALDALERLLKDPDRTVRVQAAAALWKLDKRTKTTLPVLIEAVAGGDSLLRGTVIEALAAMGPEAAPAVPALATVLRDEHHLTRRAAAAALGRIGPAAREALPALRAALQDEEPEVRRQAAEAIKAIDPQGAGG